MHTDARTLDNGTVIEGDLCIVGMGATVLDEPCVVDGNLITARFPYDLPRLVKAMVKQLLEQK